MFKKNRIAVLSVLSLWMALALVPSAFAGLQAIGPVLPTKQFNGNPNTGFPQYVIDINGMTHSICPGRP